MTLRSLASCAPLLAATVWAAACSSGSSSSGSSDDGYATCPTDAPMTCPATVPSWSTDVQPIIDKTCALGGQCHGVGGAEESQYNYTSYAGVKENYVTMWTELEGCKMPPSDAVAPTDAEWLTMITWFVCGAPDN
jgi:hypothetical protein